MAHGPNQQENKSHFELPSAVIQLDTEEKYNAFMEYLTTPNPANEKIREMIRNTPPIPRRQRTESEANDTISSDR